MKVTLKDIAKKADVSVATVSLVINNKDGRIPDETREKVKEIAKELNYVPNYSARSLVLQRSNSIGLIIPDLMNPYFSTLAKTAVAELREEGYVCIILDSDGLYDKDMELLDYLKSRNVDGILYTMSNESYKYEDKVVKKLEELNIPIVFLDRNIEGFPTVTFDNIHGGYIATKSLLDAGHKNIGVITGPLFSRSGLNRYQGYKKALEESGIEFDEDKVIEGDYNFSSGYDNAEHFINKDINAIVAANDMSAFGFIKKAKEKGYYAGRNYSIVGYDNLDITEVMDVSLSSVNQDIETLAKIGTTMLLSLINEEVISEYEIIKPTLVERESIRKSKG